MPNDMAYYPVTRRALVDRLRDIKRTLTKVHIMLQEQTLSIDDWARTVGLIEGALHRCDLMREDLDLCRNQPKRKPKPRRINVIS